MDHAEYLHADQNEAWSETADPDPELKTTLANRMELSLSGIRGAGFPAKVSTSPIYCSSLNFQRITIQQDTP